MATSLNENHPWKPRMKRFYGDGSPIRKRWKPLKNPEIALEVLVEEEQLNQALHPWYGLVWYAHGRSTTELMHDLLPKFLPSSLSGVSLLYLCLCLCISSVQRHSEALIDTWRTTRVLLLSVDLNRFQHCSVSPYQRRGSLVAARVSTNHES